MRPDAEGQPLPSWHGIENKEHCCRPYPEKLRLSYFICPYRVSGRWLTAFPSLQRVMDLSRAPLTVQAVSDRMPFIADLKPSGKFVMEDLHNVRAEPQPHVLLFLSHRPFTLTRAAMLGLCTNISVHTPSADRVVMCRTVVIYLHLSSASTCNPCRLAGCQRC